MIDRGEPAATLDIQVNQEAVMNKTRAESDPVPHEGDFESSGTEPEDETEPSHDGGGYPSGGGSAQWTGPSAGDMTLNLHLRLEFSPAEAGRSRGPTHQAVSFARPGSSPPPECQHRFPL